MAWTTPRTWVADELVTAALLNEQLRDNLNVLFTIIPTGATVPYAGALGSVPAGWLICDGSAVSRTTYATLFAAISTSFGTGDGSTTFNLPDLRGRFPLGKDNLGGTSANRVTAAAADTLGGSGGSENHTLSSAEMPSHTHGMDVIRGSSATNNVLQVEGDKGTRLVTNAASNIYNTSNYGNFGTDDGTYRGIWDSIIPTGGGGAHNNMSPYITLNYIIKT